MFKRAPTENHFIAITFILVVLMGIPTFQTLTAKELTDEELEGVSTAVLTTADRAPASIPASRPEAISTSSLPSFTQVDLNCSKNKVLEAKLTGGFLQLKGKNCLKDITSSEVQIENKSNGFTASIFQQGIDGYQTDLIQLQKGENEISIRYRDKSGKSVEQILRVQALQI